MERIRFYRLLMRFFFVLKWGFVFMFFYGGESFKLPFLDAVELLLPFGSKRLLVECGNSAELGVLFLLFIDSVSPMQFIAFHIDVFVIEKISYKEVVV